VRFQPRFRLEPLGDGTARQPIVFYVDPAVPEPVRTALVEGGNWWREGFAAIGLPGAFRVEVLPPGLDRHDPGVNGVWWVHRSGRGWSFGHGLADPRTGEILTGRVLLGSERVQQVTALAEALIAPYGQPDEADRAAAVREFVLARMRHLAAHEIGHALGFMHNFASTLHPKPSVMDYPHPVLSLGPDGAPDLSRAYSQGLGPWDVFLVRHAYGFFPAGQEEAGLAALRRQAADEGLVYVADEEGGAADAAHADGAPWTAPGSALAGLEEILRVRQAALSRFCPGVLPPGRQAGELEERAALLYLLHRHQVTAVARLIGGVRYAYANAGDGPADSPADGPADGSPAAFERTAARAVDAADQRAALARLAGLLAAEHLAFPPAVLDALVPPASGCERTADYLDTASGRLFDPLSAAEAGAGLVAAAVLEPTRLNRAAWQHARDRAVPGVTDIVDALLAATWRAAGPDSESGGPDGAAGPDGDAEAETAAPADVAVQRAANWVVLRYLLETLQGDVLHPQVRAEIRHSLRTLAGELRGQAPSPVARAASADAEEAARLITASLSDPSGTRLDPLPRIPPGAPL
jgi:hypothetical protein